MANSRLRSLCRRSRSTNLPWIRYELGGRKPYIFKMTSWHAMYRDKDNIVHLGGGPSFRKACEYAKKYGGKA